MTAGRHAGEPLALNNKVAFFEINGRPQCPGLQADCELSWESFRDDDSKIQAMKLGSTSTSAAPANVVNHPKLLLAQEIFRSPSLGHDFPIRAHTAA